jgi:hypothetical protein
MTKGIPASAGTTNTPASAAGARRRTIWRALGAVVLLHAAGAATATDVDPPIDPQSAQPNWRWIGERVNTAVACPRRTNDGRTLPNWTVQPLFCEPADPQNQDNGVCKSEQDGPIPPGLRAFCSYELTSHQVPGNDLNTLLQLVTDHKLKNIAPDSMAVTGLGSQLQDQTWQALETNFKNVVGRPTSSPVPFDASPLVRIAIIDTQPTDDVLPDTEEHNSPHGNALVNMAHEVLCNNSGACAATVASRLALAYVCPLDRDFSNPACRDIVLGGWVGTIGNLARAIRLETREWIDPAVSGHRLVLNLSVAWDPRFGGLETNLNAMPEPVRAVYAAIADAQCRGALTFAAAGNLTGGFRDFEPQTGPMLPAAWEQRSAPKKSECQSRLGITPPNIFPPAGSDQRPFVYAVGGIRADDVTLANARIDAEPRLVAFGDHADADDASLPPPVAPTATLTGSSVATLVASTAAASTWFIADKLAPNSFKPFAIAEQLYATGDKLGRDANFCRGGTPANPCPAPVPEVTEIQICAAVDSIAGSSTCPTVTPLHLDIDDLGYTLVSISSLRNSVTDPVCDGMTTHYTGANPSNPCPFSQYLSELAEPWTTPQPPDSPCPNCGKGARVAFAGPNAGGSLFIQIDDDREWTLTDATLQCGTSLNRLPVATLHSGDKIMVALDDETRCPTGSDMVLYFLDDRGESTINPVLDAD